MRTGTGTGNPGYKFGEQVSYRRKMDEAGVLAMANSGPNTNGSQFFITLKETNYLNGKHTVFERGDGRHGHDAVDRRDQDQQARQ